MTYNRGTSWLVTIYVGTARPLTEQRLLVVNAPDLATLERIVRTGLEREAVYHYELSGVTKLADTTFCADDV
jgi:hypothetical protein